MQAHTLASIGIAREWADDEGGLADLERSIEIAEAASSPESVRGYANLGSLLANRGDLRGAFELYARARGPAERFGDARGLRWLDAERLYERYWRGHWGAALADANAVLAAVDEGQPHYMEIDARLVRAWICLARGAPASALADAERASPSRAHPGRIRSALPRSR